MVPVVHLDRPIRPVRATRDAPAQVQPGIIVLRRLPVAGGGSRRTRLRQDNAVFSRESFTRTGWSSVEREAHVLPTLRAFRAGRAYPNRHEI